MPRFRLLRHLRRTGKRSRLTIPLVAWIGGILISLAVFLTLRSYNNQILRHDFQTASQERVELLQQKIMRSTEVLFAMKALFTANPDVSRAQFSAFTQSALNRQPEVKALEWVPRIPHSQRESIEAAARAEGYSHFQFNQKDDANNLTRALDSSEYFPVLFVEPPTSNEPAFGYDLSSCPIRNQALTRARDTGLPAATAPVLLAQEPSSPSRPSTPPSATGILVLLPVYNPPASDPASTDEPATLADRRSRIKGFVLAVFRINDLLGPTISDFASSGINARVEDLESNALIYPASLASKNSSTLEEQIPLNVGNRAWLIRLQPSPAFTSRALTPGQYTCWAALIAGIILSTILGAYLLASLHRTTWMERHVSRRTSQLSSEILVRKHAESQARAAAAMYKSIFENAVEGIFQTSIEGRYIAANRSLAKIYGYASPQTLIEALSSISDQLYVDPSRRAAFAAAVQQHGELHDFESQVYRRDGSIIWISENARAVRNESGAVLYYEGTVVDITQRKAAEDSLRQSQTLLEARVRERTAELHSANALLTSEIEVRKAAEARAEAASSAKSSFLASMSHEIRTPMNAILGYAQILSQSFSKDPSLQPSHRKAVDTILSSGRHLIGVINEILDLAKIESGRTELTLEPTNIPELARSVEAMFLHRCEQKNIALHFQFLASTSDNPHQLRLADSRKLRQILINLVGNAVKFTDSGSVSLALTQLSSTSFQFAITDTGPGIPEDILDYIFEPFCQGRAGTLHGGTGLGLTIAKQLLQLMHAPLTVQSTLGHGTTFSFTLQLAPALSEPASPTPLESEPLPPLAFTLPPKLRQSLTHAIALQSPTEIRRLLETLDPQSPETQPLTQTIHHHLKTYNFPALTHLLKEQSEQPTLA